MKYRAYYEFFTKKAIGNFTNTTGEKGGYFEKINWYNYLGGFAHIDFFLIFCWPGVYFFKRGYPVNASNHMMFLPAN